MVPREVLRLAPVQKSLSNIRNAPLKQQGVIYRCSCMSIQFEIPRFSDLPRGTARSWRTRLLSFILFPGLAISVAAHMTRAGYARRRMRAACAHIRAREQYRVSPRPCCTTYHHPGPEPIPVLFSFSLFFSLSHSLSLLFSLPSLSLFFSLSLFLSLSLSLARSVFLSLRYSLLLTDRPTDQPTNRSNPIDLSAGITPRPSDRHIVEHPKVNKIVLRNRHCSRRRVIVVFNVIVQPFCTQG